MTIFFYGIYGVVGLKVDEHNIQFLNGEAYFSSNDIEYRINTKNIIEIVKD